ncbi:tetratricopeptide repeat protein [Umezawaea endophytica]|uniref:Tetratricopeptide repeat protein n=1 Tax=Umezawaea endophytica TaxID=1654476 RepID=A0A9X3ALQ6_9PSEU|nr:hypothetical protein [Umezawaea endophytica]MCS7484860.1 hypothetical protein [Umezawaea endophytica]
MNALGQLVDQPPVTMIEPLISSPVRPGNRGDEASFVIAEGFRKTTQDEDILTNAVSSWITSARSYAQHLIESGRSSSIAQARLAHAQLAAGMFDEAKHSAQETLQKVERDIASNGLELFDHSSATAVLRVMLQLGEVESAARWIDRLPTHYILSKLRASIAAEQRDYDLALTLLESVESAESASLRGYIYLQQSKPQMALRELRVAAQAAPGDPNITLNMAFAFWHLGSTKKAIRHARQASRIAPSRKDISFALLELLFATGQYQAVFTEINFIRSGGVIETPDLLMMRARVELALERHEPAVRALRRALAASKEIGDVEYVEAIQTNLEILEPSRKNRPKKDAESEVLHKIRTAIKRSPDNVALVEMFAANAHRVANSAELRKYLDRLAPKNTQERLSELNLRLAYLEGRFDDALSFADAWSEAEPFNPQAASIALMFRGQLIPDGSRNEPQAVKVAARFAKSSSALNNIAHSLTLCGRADIARKILKESSQAVKSSFYLKATAGLVEVASGNLESGMRLYRLAAEMADSAEDGQIFRALMTLHQAMALRQLGILNCPERNSILAQALPPTSLPDDWMDRPHFRLLQAGAERRGWEWPLEIE